MKTTQPTRTKQNLIVASLDLTKTPRGHRPHKTGSGVHKPRTTKRNRTRGQQLKRAIAAD